MCTTGREPVEPPGGHGGLAVTAMPVTGVHAVVVSFQPDWQRLAAQFERLRQQVEHIVWIDNGSDDRAQASRQPWTRERVHPIWLDANRGLGHAQNLGIEWARGQGASHVLLMDDDSLPQPGMVAALLDALARDEHAAAAGPFYWDPRRAARDVFFRTRNGRVRRHACEDGAAIVDVDYTIASGCLIPSAFFDRVGLMREDFFIEWIDVEWCLRAHARGHRVLGVCAARLEHRLGDRMIRVGGRELPLHPPWRHYYQARNFVLMLRGVELDALTRWRYTLRQLARLLFFSTWPARRASYLRMWLLGLAHGLRGQSGAPIRPGAGGAVES